MKCSPPTGIKIIQALLFWINMGGSIMNNWNGWRVAWSCLKTIKADTLLYSYAPEVALIIIIYEHYFFTNRSCYPIAAVTLVVIHKVAWSKIEVFCSTLTLNVILRRFSRPRGRNLPFVSTALVKAESYSDFLLFATLIVPHWSKIAFKHD